MKGNQNWQAVRVDIAPGEQWAIVSQPLETQADLVEATTIPLTSSLFSVVTGMLNGTAGWVGYERDSSTPSVFNTKGGSKGQFFNWAVGSPSSDTTKKCVVTESRMWRDTRCSEFHDVVCEVAATS